MEDNSTASYPPELSYTKQHLWIRLCDDVAAIGITHHAQRRLGVIVYVDLLRVGSELRPGKPMGSVESVKEVFTVESPFSGEVVGTNDSLAIAPERVNESPYGEGWLVKIRLSKPDEIQQLLSAADYERYVSEEAAK